MARPKGSKNKRTLSDQEAARQQIINEYLESQKKAPAAPKEPETEKITPDAPARETLDLECLDDAPEPAVEPVPEPANEPTIEVPDEPSLDLEPPPRPVKVKKEIPVDKTATRIVKSPKRPAFAGSDRVPPKPPTATRKRPLGGVYRR